MGTLSWLRDLRERFGNKKRQQPFRKKQSLGSCRVGNNRKTSSRQGRPKELLWTRPLLETLESRVLPSFFTITEFDFTPYDINNNGQIAGATSDAAGHLSGAIFWDPTFGKHEIPSPQELSFSVETASAINDHGQVVVMDWDDAFGSAAVWTPTFLPGGGIDGNLEVLPGLGLSGTERIRAGGINNKGQVIGDVLSRNVIGPIGGLGDVSNGVIWNSFVPSTLPEISIPGSNEGGLPTDLNDNSQIVGVQSAWNDQALQDSFAIAWNPQGDIILGARDSFTIAINETGEVVGAENGTLKVWDASTGNVLRVLDTAGLPPLSIFTSQLAIGITNSGEVYDIRGNSLIKWDSNGDRTVHSDIIDPSLGWSELEGFAVNDHGQIVGRGVKNTFPTGNFFTGFLLEIPDLIASQLQWNTDKSGVDLTYDVIGSLPSPGTTVDVYWASGPTFEDRIGGPIHSIPAENMQGSYPVHVPQSHFSNPPLGATHVIVVADPPSADKPNGQIIESNENNNVAALRHDFAATGIKYVHAESIEDDKIEISYFVDAAASDITLDIYWSRTEISSITQFGQRLDSAARLHLSGADLLPGKHTKTITVSSVSSLRKRPEQADYLVLHVDSDSGSTFDGKFSEQDDPDDNNNFESLDIRPDIIAKEIRWNPKKGGADIDYKVEHRFWVTEPIEVLPFWETSFQATENTHEADHSEISLHLPASEFKPPTVFIDVLRVIFDPENKIEEQNDGNNQAFEPLIGLQPEIEFSTTGELNRKKNYHVFVKITNAAPVPINFTLDWQEQELADSQEQELADSSVRDANSLKDPADAESGTRFADRSFEGHEFTLGFNADTKISLGSLDSEGNLDLDASFRRTWNWIPVKNEFKETTKKLWELAAPDLSSLALDGGDLALKILNHPAAGAGAAIGNLKTLIAIDRIGEVKTTREVTLQYKIDVTALAQGGITTTPPPEDVTLGIPDEQTKALALYTTIAKFAQTQAALGVAALKELKNPLNVPTAPLAFQQAVLNIKQASDAYDDALDPPDPNFTVLVEPELPTELVGHEGLPGLLKNQLLAHRQIAVLDEAGGISLDRSLGAELAGEVDWQSQQLLALSEFASLSSILYTDVIAAGKLQESWTKEVLAPDFWAARDDIATNGLPVFIIDTLTDRGASPEEIDLIETAILASSENPLEDPAFFNSLLSFSAPLAMESAINDLIAAIDIRINLLEEEVLAVTDEQRTALDDGRSKIDELLNTKIPTASLKTLIVEYIDQVRSLVNDSNNVPDLLEDLHFGYGALFHFQHLDATPAGLQSHISTLETAGKITPEVANLLVTTLAEAEAQLAIGNFDGLPATLALFLNQVEEYRGQGISDAAAENLADFASYVDSVIINPAAKQTPVITWADPADIVYGTAVDGTQLNATAATADTPGTFVYDVTAGTVLDAGSYTLNVAFTPDDTVKFNNANASVQLNVDPATLTVTADNQSREYGDANPTLTGTVIGVTNNDNISAGYSTTAVATSAVGSYDIVPALNDPDNRLSNYNVTINNGTLSVTPATLTITGPTLSREYGDANPNLSGTFSGAKNNETFTVSGSTTADLTSPIGDYAITPSASGATLSNYNVVANDGTLTVTEASLAVTPDNASREYGDANPALSGSIVGLKNNDAVTASYSTTADAASSVGGYDITAALSDPDSKLGNYDVTLNTGTLTVTAASLAVTPDDQSKTYGDSFTAFTGTITGIKNNDDITADYSSIGAPATASVTGSPYAIAATLSDPNSKLGNYNVTLEEGELTVNKAALSVTVDDIDKFFGQPNPDFAVSYDGFVLSENESVLGGALAFSTTAVLFSDTGVYPVSASGQTSVNYAITYVDGQLEILKASPTIEVTGGSFIFDGQPHPATGSVTGVANENLGSPTFTYSYADGNGTVVTLPAAEAPVEPGIYNVVGLFAGNNNYEAASGTTTVTITFEVNTLTDFRKVLKSGRTIPIKLQLLDANGENISSSDIDVSALRLERLNEDGTREEATLNDSGNSNPDNLFRYDEELGGYIFNLSTKGLSAGDYAFTWAADNLGDPIEHELTFELK